MRPCLYSPCWEVIITHVSLCSTSIQGSCVRVYGCVQVQWSSRVYLINYYSVSYILPYVPSCFLYYYWKYDAAFFQVSTLPYLSVKRRSDGSTYSTTNFRSPRDSIFVVSFRNCLQIWISKSKNLKWIFNAWNDFKHKKIVCRSRRPLQLWYWLCQHQKVVWKI